MREVADAGTVAACNKGRGPAAPCAGRCARQQPKSCRSPTRGPARMEEPGICRYTEYQRRDRSKPDGEQGNEHGSDRCRQPLVPRCGSLEQGQQRETQCADQTADKQAKRVGLECSFEGGGIAHAGSNT